MNDILAQAKWPDGSLTPWANKSIGNSPYLIHAKGCFITEIAEILGTTPDVVNDKLTTVNGFAKDKDGYLDEVIWEKIHEAFPGWIADYQSPYDNAKVLDYLKNGHNVIVQVDAAPIGNPGGLHAVRYIGNGECHDPWTGKLRPTSDFPDVKAFNILSKVEQPTEANQPVNSYKGLDLNNSDSVKAAIDAWSDVANGLYVKADQYAAFSNKVTEALGISETSPLEVIITSINDLKAKANPPEPTAITLANLPPHEKNALLGQVENAASEIKKLLGL